MRVQALGVADVLEDPRSEVGEAAVLRQHQPRPGVTLDHIQGRDCNGTPHLSTTHASVQENLLYPQECYSILL